MNSLKALTQTADTEFSCPVTSIKEPQLYACEYSSLFLELDVWNIQKMERSGSLFMLFLRITCFSCLRMKLYLFLEFLLIFRLNLH